MLLTLILSLLVSTIPLKPVSEANNAFGDGERLSFTLHYNWGVINADVAKVYANVDIADDLWGQRCYHTHFWGRSARFFDVFFKIREDFQSWFTTSSLKPSRFTRKTNEGNYVCHNDYSYMWDEGVINATLYSSKRGHRKIQIPLSKEVYDVPCLFYLCRNLDLDKVQPGNSIPLTFAIDDDVYTIMLKREKDEVINVEDIGKVSAVKFIIGVVAGEVFESEEMPVAMWFSNDGNRIPLYFECMLKIGAMTGHLNSYKGLMHPFTALQK